MTTPNTIRVKCPKCGAVARGNDSHLARDLNCPRCHEVVRFIAVTEQPEPAPPSRTTSPRTPPPIQPPQSPVDTTSPTESQQHDIEQSLAGNTRAQRESEASREFDNHQKISAWIAGVGLLVLAISPFFMWVKFGVGGVTGLAGDGKILLGLTVIAGAGFAVTIVKRKWLTPALLSAQGWATITVFWMGALIWKVGSFLESSDMKDNPFAAIFATQISPGAGLYLGLIGGIIVAAAAGFLAVSVLAAVGKLKLYYISQGVSCALGIVLAFFVGPGRPSPSNDTAANSPFELNIGNDEADHEERKRQDEARQREEERLAAIKRAYIDEHIELYDVTARYMDSLLHGKVPGVLFKIRNKGDKPLNRVEVTIYFKDAGGSIIAEENFLPVLAREYSFAGNNKPLKAGYVWQMESGKFYSAKSVPTEWQEGSIDAEIMDIEFGE